MTTQSKPATVKELSSRFIELANEMKDAGQDIKRISSGLMQASAIYATYVAAGNEGYLRDSGVKKVADVYVNGLRELQQLKKAVAEQQGLKPREAIAPMPIDDSDPTGER